MSEHERIWLEAAPGSDEEYGRQWCQHNVWPDGVEYVRADLTPPPSSHVMGSDIDVEDIREQKLATIAAPDNGTTDEVLAAVLECATAWVPEARIVGNVRAGDIVKAVRRARGALGREALASTPTTLTNEQKEITLLRIIAAMGGNTDSSESKWSWLNWFCGDEIHGAQDDTFNRCHAKG